MPLRRLLLWLPRLIAFHFYYRAGLRFGAADEALRVAANRSSPFVPQEPTETEWQVIRSGRELSRRSETIYRLGGTPIARYIWREARKGGSRNMIYAAVFR